MTVASGSVKSDPSDSFTICFSFYNAKIVRIERIVHFSGTQQLNLTSVVKVRNIQKLRPRRYWSSNILPGNYTEHINPLSGCIGNDKLTSQNENQRLVERIKMVRSLTNIGCRLSSVIPLDGG